MDTRLILAELRAERQRIDQAITALGSLDHAGRKTTATGLRAETRPPPHECSRAQTHLGGCQGNVGAAEEGPHCPPHECGYAQASIRTGEAAMGGAEENDKGCLIRLRCRRCSRSPKPTLEPTTRADNFSVGHHPPRNPGETRKSVHTP